MTLEANSLSNFSKEANVNVLYPTGEAEAIRIIILFIPSKLNIVTNIKPRAKPRNILILITAARGQ